MRLQVIGLDVGRGCTKGYTSYREQVSECCFKSMRSGGRNIEFKKFDDFEDPIYISYNERDHFVGELAEKEGNTLVQNLEDDKTTTTVDILIAAALSKIAVSDKVAITLGVPHKCYTQKHLKAIKAAYKGKTYKVRDYITGAFKEVTVVDIAIFKEADAALLWHTEHAYELSTNDVAMVNVGYRTTELSYYDNIDGELVYNNKKSDTLELGNITALEDVNSVISSTRKHYEIDSSSRYDKEKKHAYEDLKDAIQSSVEAKWINLNEVDIFAAGGTAKRLDLDYKLVEDSQMATAKGLYAVGVELFEYLDLNDIEEEMFEEVEVI